MHFALLLWKKISDLETLQLPSSDEVCVPLPWSYTWPSFTHACYFPDPHRHLCLWTLNYVLFQLHEDILKQTYNQAVASWSNTPITTNLFHLSYVWNSFALLVYVSLFYARGREYSVTVKSMAFDIIQKWFEPWQYCLLSCDLIFTSVKLDNNVIYLMLWIRELAQFLVHIMLISKMVMKMMCLYYFVFIIC